MSSGRGGMLEGADSLQIALKTHYRLLLNLNATQELTLVLQLRAWQVPVWSCVRGKTRLMTLFILMTCDSVSWVNRVRHTVGRTE